MITIFSKRTAALLKMSLVFFAIVLFTSCQKDLKDTGTPIIPGNESPDLSSRVSSSVSGFVTDENNDAVAGAAVTAGAVNVTTDAYGYFVIRNINVIKNAAMVTVTRNGYFKGIKTYIAAEGKSAFFRIKLIPKTDAGSISAASGGNVSLSNGLMVALPANAVVTASTGNAYTGNIHVAAAWIDPTATDLNNIMPGDLRAVNAAGALQSLKTFGMTAIELTGDGGELLQVATGKKATLTLSIPASLAVNAPASIPLWYFDEALGLWKEEGTATKTGNTYVGEVSHFSFWNCDVPNNYVQFRCTVLDADGNPMAYVPVRISVVADPANARWGYTDSTGFVSGAIPDNAQLKLEVLGSAGCGNIALTQTFSTTNIDVDLGNITLPASSNTVANVSGSVTDCNSAPVNDGFIMVTKNNEFTRYDLTSAGTYDFSTLICASPATLIIVAENNTTGIQAQPVTFSTVTGNNSVPVILACTATSEEFVSYTINGLPSSFLLPEATFTHSGNAQSNTVINVVNSSNPDNASISYYSDSIQVGSMQVLSGFTAGPATIGAPGYQLVPTNTVLVNITEYGNVGEFISGNFAGVLFSQGTTLNYDIICSFRVRRNF